MVLNILQNIASDRKMNQGHSKSGGVELGTAEIGDLGWCLIESCWSKRKTFGWIYDIFAVDGDELDGEVEP
ncbi:hypothetical protein CDL12_16117 [Handroanthus impetiginosus]|uniref:Uncharacterized protein n=1 Tax=Handroanthus impetiginosus TaxID=429701 RepID=A0A2G9H1C3_9LAMI|nr:hypothetical protein CDL12_16117 [Handroanthus impetiginosus]